MWVHEFAWRLALAFGVLVAACAGAPSTSPVSPMGSSDAPVRRGLVVFGTGGSECSLKTEATSFPRSTPFRLVAYFERMRAGQNYTMRVTGPKGVEETDEGPFPYSTDCLWNDVYERGFRPRPLRHRIPRGQRGVGHGRIRHHALNWAKASPWVPPALPLGRRPEASAGAMDRRRAHERLRASQGRSVPNMTRRQLLVAAVSIALMGAFGAGWVFNAIASRK